MKVHFIAVSQNAKTGPIPVSIIERASCWRGCALYENGCYAETGALATFRRKKPFSDDRATKLGARTRWQVAADKL